MTRINTYLNQKEHYLHFIFAVVITITITVGLSGNNKSIHILYNFIYIRHIGKNVRFIKYKQLWIYQI